MFYQVILTKNCNFRCEYCYQKFKNEAVMTDDNIEKMCLMMINETLLADKKLFVSISGGECLLYPEKVKKIIRKLISDCKRNKLQNLSINISTNGSLFTKEIISFFIKTDCDLFIGFDGLSVIQNMNRKYKNEKNDSYKVVLLNLEQLIETKGVNLKKITINTVIAANNVRYLTENFDFMFKKFFGILFSYNIAYNTDWTEEDLSILDCELKELALKYINILLHIDSDFEIPLFDRQIRFNIRENFLQPARCEACESAFGISPDGDILSCSTFISTKAEKDVIIGNLKSDLNSDLCKKFTANLSSLNALVDCVNCNFHKRCYIFCPSTNLLCSGNMFKISSVQCVINKILIYIADFIIDEIYKKAPEILQIKIR